MLSAEKKPGVVSVIVTTEEGNDLGKTLFTYVDPQEKEEEEWENLMSDEDKMGKLFKRYGKRLQRQGKKKDTKSVLLSGELNCVIVQC